MTLSVHMDALTIIPTYSVPIVSFKTGNLVTRFRQTELYSSLVGNAV